MHLNKCRGDYNKKIGKANLLELKKILVAIAGPITNFIIILITMKTNSNVFFALLVLYSNALLMIFNLIPIYPLDGGRILKGFLHIFLGKRKAEKYCNNISFITLIIITFISSIVIYKVKNIAIFLIILILWGMFIKEDRIYRKRNEIYNLITKTIENN